MVIPGDRGPPASGAQTIDAGDARARHLKPRRWTIRRSIRRRFPAQPQIFPIGWDQSFPSN
jgi:hypothetical protein